MKRLITLILILCSLSSIGQITSASYTNKGATVPFINSSSYKLNGVVQYFITTGAGTCKIGFQSGYSETESAARYNVFAGYSSGYTNISGTNNVYIGKSSGYLSTGSNNIFIGSEAGTFTTKSNRIIIGSMQNSASEAQDTTKNIIYALQNINPTYNKLTINGSLNVTGSIYKNNNPIDLWTLNNNRLTYQIYNDFEGDSAFTIFDNPGGVNVIKINTLDQTIVFDDAEQGDYQVGINTRTPDYTLDVNGVIKSSSYLIQQGIYAGIYVDDGSTAQSIANGTTYTKSTAFTTNGNAANCTADAANDKITITKTGKYMVMGTCSFTSGTNSVVWRSAAFLGGVEQGNIHWARKVGTGSDVGSASFMGTINVTSVPVDLDVRFRQDQAGAINITVVYSNITVNYIGE